MKMLSGLMAAQRGFARFMDRLQSLLLLATRCYVGWQFTKSGWLKYSSWDTTLGLFRDEYHVPLLPPESRPSWAPAASSGSRSCCTSACSRASARSARCSSTRWR